MQAWTRVAAGVWHLRVGTPDGLTPRQAAGAQPRLEALAAMGEADLPAPAAGLAEVSVPGRTVMVLPLLPDEAVFGLGLQFMKVNQRGRTRYLRVNSDPRQDTGESHAPVPFYVSSAGYGLLVDTARIATVYCGSCGRRDPVFPPAVRDRGRDRDWAATPTADTVEIVTAGPGVDVYAFAGPAMLDVVRRYNLFNGGGVLPPRWGLGFWHRVHYQYRDAQVLEEAGEFRRRGYPCDVIGLEPGWHSKSYPCTYEWGADRFPDPAGFVHRMAEQGFRVNLWEHPYVSPAAAIHADLAALSGSHTVWGGLAPDFTLEAARRIVQDQHDREHVSIGVSGYKLDECDGSELTGCSWMFPGHATFPSGHDGEQMRQVYGLLLQRLTTDLFRRHDRRTYGLARASNAGASALPYVLYSDLYDHREFVRALCNSGFSGLLWTPEIRGAGSAEEWVRRMQVVCLSPLAMLNAWSCSTKPWTFGDVETYTRAAMELRMRLIPYLYAAFARYREDGTPPFRAMVLEAGTDPQAVAAAAGLDTQFMVGDHLLVAPLFAGQTSREVWLPAGDWYDFDTGERFAGGGQLSVKAGLEKVPIFVRDGGIVPLMPALPHVPGRGESVPLEVRHYGRRPGEFRLFDDDGETYACERGGGRWRTLRATVSSSGVLSGNFDPPLPGQPSAYADATWRFLGG